MDVLISTLKLQFVLPSAYDITIVFENHKEYINPLQQVMEFLSTQT